MKKGPLLAGLGVMAVGVVVAAVTLLKPHHGAAPAAAAQKAGSTDGATAQWVGVASGTTPLHLVDTGPVDYSYIPQGWSYTGTRKDW